MTHGLAYGPAFDRDVPLLDSGITRPMDGKVLRLISGAELLTYPEPTFLVGEILLDQGVVFMTSRYSHGKSAAALTLAEALAGEASDWLGHQVHRHGVVVYLVAEAPAGLGARYKRLLERAGCAHTPWPNLHFIPEAVPFMQDTASDRILEAITAAGITPSDIVLFVVDTWHRCGAGSEENSNDDARDRLATAQRIAGATGGLVLILAHPAKNGEGSVRGAGSAEDDADAVIRLVRQPKSDMVTVSCGKLRDAAEFEDWSFRLVEGLAEPLDPAEVVRREQENTLGPGSLHRVLLLRLADSPATNKQLREAAVAANHGDRSVTPALSWLTGKRLVHEPPTTTRRDGKQQAKRGGAYTITHGGQVLTSGWQHEHG